MAEVSISPNNISVKFRGRADRERPRAMPVVSKAQNAAMHAAEQGNSTLGIPKSVGKEFVADQAPGSVKNLPERVGKPSKPKEPPHIGEARKLHRRGVISRKQLDKLTAGGFPGA